ncbi:MAG: ABC transporter permease, partial [Longimicrobiales bacterium]
IKLDAIALAFTLGITVLTTAFSGIIPALQASRAQVTDVLKDESRGSSSFRLGRVSRALVVFEIALSCGLLVAAGLTIKSVVKLRNVNLGFDSSNVFTARVSLDEVSYPQPATYVQFYENLVPRLAALPGVKAVSLASSLPGVGEGNYAFAVEGVTYDRDQDFPNAPRIAIQPGYFQMLGLKLLEGRDLNSADRADGLPVVLVNRSFARKYFPDQSAVGRRIRLGNSQSTRPWLTIAGVVPDATAGELGEDPPEVMYVPFAQNAQRSMAIVARTQGDALGIISGVRETVAALNADLPIYQTRELRDAIAAETWFYRVFGVLFMIFGLIALLLAAIGLYAVMSFSVSQRTREVGIRMAVGAQARDVLKMIMRQGLLQVGLGMVFGLIFALLMSRLLSIILFDVQPRDPLIFGSIALILVITALAACLVPARRATSVHPLEALRFE